MKANVLKKDLEKITNFATDKDVIITIEHGYINYTSFTEKLIIPVEIDSTINCSVSLLELYKVIKALKTKEISFSQTDAHLQIVTGKTKLDISFCTPLEFPNIENDFDFIGRLPHTADLKKAVKFTSTDDLRPIIQYVYICSEHSEVVATTAHVMFFKGINSTFLKDVFLTRKAVNILDDNSPVLFSENNKYYQIEQKGMMFWIEKNTEKYPNYKAVIPDNKRGAMKLTLNRKELIEFIDLAKIQGNRSTNRLDFNTSENEVILKSENIDFNRSVSLTIDTPEIKNYNDIPAKFALNFIFLEQILKLDKDDYFSLFVNQPNRAVLIDDNYLIMPMIREY